jgi:hypothetical protein
MKMRIRRTTRRLIGKYFITIFSIPILLEIFKNEEKQKQK